MLKVVINFKEFFFNSNISVLEACKLVGISIPRFCYHEILSIAGNCRMCLVEIQNSIKPVAACALPISNNLYIFIDTPLVKKARENVIEFLLLNHPLDCPICDQGGECDLQDQAKIFGNLKTRFFFNKKSVKDKFISPFIDTIMTRCIHCTRCVRFDKEFTNQESLGTINRGTLTEISNYDNSLFFSELSGNIIDLCPVGALTSKSYSFKIRPWELRLTDSIDIFDSFGSNIYINHNETEIFRILPKVNLLLNNYIITDKVRFFFDAIVSQRITTISFKNNNSVKYIEKSWSLFLTNFLDFFHKKEFLLILLNGNCDFESLAFFNLLTFKYGKFFKVRSIDNFLFISNYYFKALNCFSKLFETCKKTFFIVFASNLKTESAILNSRLHILSKKLNNKINYINFSINNFLLFLEGKNKILNNFILTFLSFKFFFGESLFKNNKINIQNFEILFNKLNKHINYYIINEKCNSEALAWLNIKQISTKIINTQRIHALVNLEESFKLHKFYRNLKNIKTKIWLNTHIPTTYLAYDYIVPLLSHVEEEQIFYNFCCHFQKTNKCFINSKKGLSRSLKALFSLLLKQPYSSLYIYSQYMFIHNYLNESTLITLNKCFKFIILSLTKSYINLILAQPFKLLNLNTYTLKKYCKFSFNLLKGYKIERLSFKNFNSL